MSILFSTERLSPALFAEMVPLITKHFYEISHFKDRKVEPDFIHYIAADQARVLRIYTAREAGKLIGYSVFMVTLHPHFKSLTRAHEELLFIDENERKGLTGVAFIAYCDKQLIEGGVQMIYRAVTGHLDFSPLLIRQGYELCDQVYARRIQ